jgi:hypothetical protein
MMLLAEPAGRLLERTSNRASRGMIVHDRTRLIGQLHFDSHVLKRTAKKTRLQHHVEAAG